MPTRTIAYLRVSTEKQADRGVSLDAQRAKVAAYAELYDLDLVETIIDAGESAKSLDGQACSGRWRCSRRAQPGPCWW
jgi:site-specific DNA recombinase